MLDVHEAHPTAAFELIDREVIGIWERYPGNKLIATPFGSESRDQTKHKIIRSKIFAAAADITQSQEIAVAPPTPNDKAKRDQRTPATFLIYKMTDTQYEALLQRKVWSATEITFKVAPLMPSRPSFLFSITGLTTLSVSDVFSMVKSVWEDETSVAYYQSILSSKSPDKKDTTQQALEVFVSSLWVEHLDIRIRQAGRSVLTPKFNIFAISKDIHDHNTWSNLRAFLANRTYSTILLGKCHTKIAPHDCSICHGTDHPKGLCPFPRVPNWNGPTWRGNQN